MRKFSFFILITALFLWAPSDRAWANPARLKDLVFDLDWTLFYSWENTKDSQSEVDPLLKHKNSTYQASKNAVPVLLSLQDKGYRLSIFSGGDEHRNQQLVEWLQKEAKLRYGKNLKFYKTLGFRALTERSQASGLKFSQRYGKDLSQINSNLDQILLIDDIRDFAMKGQESNLLHLEKTYNYIADYDTWSRSKTSVPNSEQSYDPPSYKEWIREQNKIERVLELIELSESTRPIKQSGKIPNVIHNLQSLASKEQCRYLLLD